MAVSLAAQAQDKYPSKPVRLIVPYAPGGATDIKAHIFGEQLKNFLGQQFVVLTAVFGVLGFVSIKLECEPAPLPLGFILGPLMEKNLRRAMRIASGDHRSGPFDRHTVLFDYRRLADHPQQAQRGFQES